MTISPARLAPNEGELLEVRELLRALGKLADGLGISQSLASQHLRVLRSTGLVAGSRRGKETLYRLADDELGLREFPL